MRTYASKTTKDDTGRCWSREEDRSRSKIEKKTDEIERETNVHVSRIEDMLDERYYDLRRFCALIWHARFEHR